MQSSTEREGLKMGGQEGFSESTLGWFRGVEERRDVGKNRGFSEGWGKFRRGRGGMRGKIF